jgi:phosphoglycolate phosphatase
MTELPVRAVIFDLDGTVVQTRESSWELFKDISAELELGIDTPDEFYDLFRSSNFFDGLGSRCPDVGRASRAVELYLEQMASNYRPPIVPGMVDVIRTLAGNATLCLISSNSMPAVRRILLDNGIAHCFAHVFTAEIERNKQRCFRRFVNDMAAEAGRHCRPDYDETARPSAVSPNEVVLVTDTVGDVVEARAVGIRVVGVAWGMHSEADLDVAGAEFVAIWPQELLTQLADPSSRCPTDSCAVTTEHALVGAQQDRPPIGIWENARAARAGRRRVMAKRPGPARQKPPEPATPPTDTALLAAVGRIMPESWPVAG